MTQGNVPVRRGRIILVTGPSGAGKNALIKEARKELPSVGFSVSATTRAPREGEIDGVHYHFVSRKKFKRMAREGAFVEHAEYAGNLYGTPYSSIESALAEGKDIFVEIETKGARELMKKMDGSVISIFIMPPEPRIETLKKRLIGRAKGPAELANLEERLATAKKEMPLARLFQHQIVNGNFGAALREFVSCVSSRLKEWRQVA